MIDRPGLIDAALGRRPFSVLIRNIRLVNVFTQESYAACIGISGRHIAYIGAEPEDVRAEAIHEGQGKYAVPGLIDPHLHIESSMVTPANYARSVVPRGTTTVIVDPHELANVFGLRGVRYVVEASRDLPLRVLIVAPSCVPSALGLETAGAAFFAEEIAMILGWERVIGLAEVMDYPGVLKGSERMDGILEAAHATGAVIQAHAPTVLGRRLAAYICAGPNLEHEARTGEEALEKLRMGMAIQARQGSNSRNLASIVRALKDLPLPENLCFCTDDLSPVDLHEVGGMDEALRLAIASGMAPAAAVCCATLHSARTNRLSQLGAIAPGHLADVVLTRDLVAFRADEVFVGGRLVAKGGALREPLQIEPFALEHENSIHLDAAPDPIAFRIEAPIAEGTVRVRVIQCGEERITATDLVELELPVREGIVRYQDRADLCLVAVIERHGHGGGRGLALIKDLGLARGAVATTVAHDSHNLLVVGRGAEDMATAAAEVIAVWGGYTAVADGVVLETVPLPIGGLISQLPVDRLAEGVGRLKSIYAELGIRGADPMFTIAGLALIVAPKYKVSDKGLIDVEGQRVVPTVI